MTWAQACGLGAFAAGAPLVFWSAVCGLCLCAALVSGPGSRRIASIVGVACGALVVAAPVWGGAADLVLAVGLIVAARRGRSRARAPFKRAQAQAASALLLGRVARVHRAEPADAQVGLDGRRWLARFDGAPLPIDARVRVLRIDTDGRLVVNAVT